jgi:type I restriction enzyme S subunit
MTPEGWLRAPVSSLGEVVAGKAKDVTGRGSSRPYLRVANVFDGRVDISDVFEMPFSEQEFVRYELREGDVLLNEGQTLELVGRCAMYRGEYEARCAIQNALIRFRAGKGITPEYAEQLFRWCQRSGIFAEIATQTTSIAHLGVKRFSDLQVRVPPLGEQKKIAAILSSVDEAIEATQAVIDELQVVKKAMMAELLTRGLPGRHTRFKQTEIGEVPEAWDVLSIEAVVASCDYGLSKSLTLQPSDVAVLRMGNLDDGRVVMDELKYIDDDEVPAALLLAPGDVLFNRTNSKDLVGKVGVFLGSAARVSFASYLLRLRPRGQHLGAWLSAVMNLPSSQAGLRAMATPGVSQVNINRGKMLALKIPVPSPREQRDVIDVLEAVDTRIAAERQTLDERRNVKAALMSVLLTGDVRVKPDEVAQ